MPHYSKLCSSMMCAKVMRRVRNIEENNEQHLIRVKKEKECIFSLVSHWCSVDVIYNIGFALIARFCSINSNECDEHYLGYRCFLAFKKNAQSEML